MAYTSVLPAYVDARAPSAAATSKRGFFARFLEAMATSRLKQAERDIALYLAHTGGKFTDEAERAIERRFIAQTRAW